MKRLGEAGGRNPGIEYSPSPARPAAAGPGRRVVV
jgi:hypothetical protein